MKFHIALIFGTWYLHRTAATECCTDALINMCYVYTYTVIQTQGPIHTHLHTYIHMYIHARECMYTSKIKTCTI